MAAECVKYNLPVGCKHLLVVFKRIIFFMALCLQINKALDLSCDERISQAHFCLFFLISYKNESWLNRPGHYDLFFFSIPLPYICLNTEAATLVKLLFFFCFEKFIQVICVCLYT